MRASLPLFRLVGVRCIAALWRVSRVAAAIARNSNISLSTCADPRYCKMSLRFSSNSVLSISRWRTTLSESPGRVKPSRIPQALSRANGHDEVLARAMNLLFARVNPLRVCPHGIQGATR
jgi:hypothetical protein